MAQPTLEQIAERDREIMYRLDNIAHISRNVNRLEPYVVAPEVAPDPAPDDPAEHDRDGDDGAVPMGRGRRVHRRRGCGTGGHM
ncbi:hypothetical protein PIB30_006504 [Stylosanthes scabra]|uniref:Uncharacterized protein n=1 Tax=Stylosanthes scabra TaxID=79078 RepID=A0ABU6V3D8_9FABA|nr:hypothetical protein [Stylosanthes scabra]